VKGVILFFYIYSIKRGKGVYIEDYIVDESLRGKGLGKALFCEFCKTTLNEGALYVKLIYQSGLKVGELYKHFGFINDTAINGVHFFEFAKGLSKLKVLLQISSQVKPLPDDIRITQASHKDIKKYVIQRTKKKGCNVPQFAGALTIQSTLTKKECLITYSLGFCGWYGNFLYIQDIVGEEAILTADILGHVLMTLLVQYDMYVWLDLPVNSQSTIPQMLATLGMEDVTDDEHWNICTLDTARMKSMSSLIGN